MRAGGEPLSDSARQGFEPRFGSDFSGVRVHTDSGAAALAQSLSARAFTVGGDIAFAAGEYRPGTQAGDRLLAHELTHVLQQGQGGPRGQSASTSLSAKPERIQRQSEPEADDAELRQAGTQSVYFALGSPTELNDELSTENRLRYEIFRFLSFYAHVSPRPKVVVEGFVSSEPQEQESIVLDWERAAGVEARFVRNGFAATDTSQRSSGTSDEHEDAALNRRVDFYFEHPIEELKFQTEDTFSVDEPELLPDVVSTGCDDPRKQFIYEAVHEARWMIDHAIRDCKSAGEPTEENLRESWFKTAIPKRVRDGLAEFFNANEYELPRVLAGLESIARSLRAYGKDDESVGKLRFECDSGDSCEGARAWVYENWPLRDGVIHICPLFLEYMKKDDVKDAGETIIHELAHLELDADDVIYYAGDNRLGANIVKILLLGEPDIHEVLPIDDWDDLDADEKYEAWRAYWRSRTPSELLDNADSYSEFVFYLDKVRGGKSPKLKTMNK